MWTDCIFLFALGSYITTALRISPCGDANIAEIPAGQIYTLTCFPSTKRMEWRLSRIFKTEVIIAKWENGRLLQSNQFDGTFTELTYSASQISLVINAVNNKKIDEDIAFVNGSMLCKDGRETADCGLNFVHPAEGVSCNAVATSWNVDVSCNITRAYSSRRIYACQLVLQEMEMSMQRTHLDTVGMATNPINEPMAKNEVKVSGFCQFSKQLPQQNGRYVYHVVISPGGLQYPAKFPDSTQRYITVERPLNSPMVICHPNPYVLENTDVTCSCNTTSLGHPEGFLRWIRYDNTSTETPVTRIWLGDSPFELHFNQTLTMRDHGSTHFRCDVIWGAEEIRGGTYTASVGPPEEWLKEGIEYYWSKTGNSFWVKNKKAPNKNWPVFSQNKILKTASKPRLLLPDAVVSLNNTQIDVTAHPKPLSFTMWYLGNIPSTTADPLEENVTAKPIFCFPHPEYRYQFRCRLTLNDSAADMAPGFYRLHVVNEMGEGRFTVEIHNHGKSTQYTNHKDKVANNIVKCLMASPSITHLISQRVHNFLCI